MRRTKTNMHHAAATAKPARYADDTTKGNTDVIWPWNDHFGMLLYDDSDGNVVFHSDAASDPITMSHSRWMMVLGCSLAMLKMIMLNPTLLLHVKSWLHQRIIQDASLASTWENPLGRKFRCRKGRHFNGSIAFQRQFNGSIAVLCHYLYVLSF